MPINLPVRQGHPFNIEKVHIVGDYRQGGGGSETDFFNQFTTSIIPGEPIVLFNRVGISKSTIKPKTAGTVVFNCWMSYMVDPNLPAEILQDDLIYFRYDLALAANNNKLSADSVYQGKFITGFASNVAGAGPNVLLGRATIDHAKRDEMKVSTTGPNKAVACPVGQNRVMVLMTQLAPVTVGAVPNFATGA